MAPRSTTPLPSRPKGTPEETTPRPELKPKAPVAKSAPSATPPAATPAAEGSYEQDMARRKAEEDSLNRQVRATLLSGRALSEPITRTPVGPPETPAWRESPPPPIEDGTDQGPTSAGLDVIQRNRLDGSMFEQATDAGLPPGASRPTVNEATQELGAGYNPSPDFAEDGTPTTALGIALAAAMLEAQETGQDMAAVISDPFAAPEDASADAGLLIGQQNRGISDTAEITQEDTDALQGREQKDAKLKALIKSANPTEVIRAISRTFIAIGRAINASFDNAFIEEGGTFNKQGVPYTYADFQAAMEKGERPGVTYKLMGPSATKPGVMEPVVSLSARVEKDGRVIHKIDALPSVDYAMSSMRADRFNKLIRSLRNGIYRNSFAIKVGKKQQAMPSRLEMVYVDEAENAAVVFDFPSLVMFGLPENVRFTEATREQLYDGATNAIATLAQMGFRFNPKIGDRKQVEAYIRQRVVDPKRNLIFDDVVTDVNRTKPDRAAELAMLESTELDGELEKARKEVQEVMQALGKLIKANMNDLTFEQKQQRRALLRQLSGAQIEQRMVEDEIERRALEGMGRRVFDPLSDLGSIADEGDPNQDGVVTPSSSDLREDGAGQYGDDSGQDTGMRDLRMRAQPLRSSEGAPSVTPRARVAEGVTDSRLAAEAAKAAKILEELGVTLDTEVVFMDDSALEAAPATNDYNGAVLKDAREQRPDARIMFLRRKGKTVDPYIYISNKLTGAARAEAILHELGHLVMRQFMSGAPAEVVDALRRAFGDPGTRDFEENFANAFVKFITQKGTEAVRRQLLSNAAFRVSGGMDRAAGGVENDPAGQRIGELVFGFFARIMDALRKLFTSFKRDFAISREFEDFFEQLINRRRRQMNERDVRPTTAFGRQLVEAMEEWSYTSSATLTEGSFASLDLTPPAQAAVRRRVDRLMKTPLGESVQTVNGWVAGFLRAYWMADDSRMRSMNNPVVTKLANDLRRVAGRADASHERSRMDDEVRGNETPFMHRIRRIAKQHVPAWKPWHMLPWVERPPVSPDMKRAVRELIDGNPQSPLALEIRGIFNDLYRWVRAHGVYVPYRKNYFPIAMNPAKLLRKGGREEFEQRIQEWAKTPEAQAWWEKEFAGDKLTAEKASNLTQHLYTVYTGGAMMEESQDGGLTFMSPGFGYRNKRKLPPDLIQALEPFREDDVVQLMMTYTKSAVRRGIWQQRYGANEELAKISEFWKTLPGDLAATLTQRLEEKFQQDYGTSIYDPSAGLKKQLLVERRAGRLTQAQLEELNDEIIPGALGTLGTDFKIFGKYRPGFRRFSAFVTVFNSMRLLSAAVLSQVVDIGATLARVDSDDRGQWIKATRKLLSQRGRDELRGDLDALGRWAHELTDHMLNDEAGLLGVSANMQRMNEWFFRLNGMQGMTNWTRAVNLSMAKELIQHWADTNQTEKLAELGITPEDVKAWVAAGKPMEWSNTHDKVIGAMNQFLDETVVHPTSSLRPRIGNDPRFMLLWSLKSFIYGWHYQILQRAWEQSKRKWGEQQGARKFYAALPFLTLAAFTLPIAAMGMELRWLLLGAPKDGRPVGWDYFEEVFNRSGNMGLASMIYDMYQTEAHGKLSIIAPLGPTIGTMYDFGTKDLSDVATKMYPAYPVVNRLAGLIGVQE